MPQIALDLHANESTADLDCKSPTGPAFKEGLKCGDMGKAKSYKAAPQRHDISGLLL